MKSLVGERREKGDTVFWVLISDFAVLEFLC